MIFKEKMRYYGVASAWIAAVTLAPQAQASEFATFDTVFSGNTEVTSSVLQAVTAHNTLTFSLPERSTLGGNSLTFSNGAETQSITAVTQNTALNATVMTAITVKVDYHMPAGTQSSSLDIAK